MNADLQKRLDRLRNRPTRYELALTKGDQKILIAYSKRGRNTIYKACCDDRRSKAIVQITGSEQIHFADTGDLATIGKWSVTFTGRTQREAIIAGELPYCVDLVTPPAATSTTPTTDPAQIDP